MPSWISEKGAISRDLPGNSGATKVNSIIISISRCDDSITVSTLSLLAVRPGTVALTNNRVFPGCNPNTLMATLAGFCLKTPIGWNTPLRSTRSLSSTVHLKSMGGSSRLPRIIGDISGIPQHQKGMVAPTLNLVSGARIFRACNSTTFRSTESLKIKKGRNISNFICF